ncbi:CwfJ C-terminus 1-domain-containing protein-like protein [Halteromyces radiatus]|uniref:CwfJ C-terminus 1-domain-containing protein-like protein n=1 Tax=Halteromyces radiatus TaxID=101107 RepID=UPI002220B166|nr:CwfJ C-terminus 1-domain-containing protein-like protein [Halteromyces radiatus]KAI8088679.1 CwfJ C-terminus 1-domain-containing protein-like protein [Halteromyces radiatus]
MEIDYSDPSLWVEKTDQDNVSSITSTTISQSVEKPSVQPQQQQQEIRHGWMLDSSFDFADFGTKKPEPKDDKPNPDNLKVSDRELNAHFKAGLAVDEYPEEKKSSIKFGDAGSNWRMMKLKRVIEQAEDERRSVEEVGLERYGSKEKFQEALDERAYLDQRKERGRHQDRSSTSSRHHHHHHHHHGESRSSRKFMFSDTDSKNVQFRRPAQQSSSYGKDVSDSKSRNDHRQKRSRTPSPTPGRVQEKPIVSNESIGPTSSIPLTPNTSTTPLVITPYQVPSTPQTEPVMTRDQLNKLNSRIVKARLMGNDEEAAALEEEYKTQVERFEAGETETETTPSGKNVAMLPTVDREGKVYEYALAGGGQIQDSTQLKGKKQYEGTHDKATGERLRYSAADDGMSLMDMVRQEKAGSRRVNNMDMEFANRIVADASFENNLDYMDDKADVMAAKKGMSEQQKMKYAISDHKRTQKALESCRFCYHDDAPPQCAMISLATQTYLALPNQQELTPGHCLIVPLQHVSSTLECDDEVWDEIRNFQKCLLRMFDEQNCGVVFMETVTSLRSHRHTVIEAIPVPYGLYEDAPAYFKEGIMEAGEEWSQHKKLIDTSSRGFRHSMVKNLPYFHVWCGLDKGYGHVIENEKEFPYWFGKEIIGGMLDVGPELWRRPKYYQRKEDRTRQTKFLKNWEKWDWTAALP